MANSWAILINSFDQFCDTLMSHLSYILCSGMYQATYNTDSHNIREDGLIRRCSVLKSSAHLGSGKAEVWELLRISTGFDLV